MKSLSRTLARSRGYTVVELMMALAIFAIGFTGIAAMQNVTASSNAHAKNIAVATQLARSWQDKLAMDALKWGGLQGWALTNTRWLGQADAQNNVWHVPLNDAAVTFGPATDARGEFVDFTTAGNNVVFCTHIRLTRLIPTANMGLIRSEVRVFWPKGPVAWSTGANYCTTNAADIAAVGAATTNFHFVYETTAIRETPSF
jgi:type IV pilus assembly protein PilV